MGSACSSETGVLSQPATDIIVYYWGPHKEADGGMMVYGRAIGIYLTLDQAGAKYEKKPPGAMPEGAAMAVPCVSLDKQLMGQTPAILTVLGEMFGLGGGTKAERICCLQAVEDMNDFFGERKKLSEDEAHKNKRFAYLEGKLKATKAGGGGAKWLAGTSEPTVADFHGVFAFEQLKAHKVNFSAFPETTKWWADIQKYPVVAAMYATGIQMVP